MLGYIAAWGVNVLQASKQHYDHSYRAKRRATMSKEGFLIYNVIASKLKVTSQVSNDSILKDINM